MQKAIMEPFVRLIKPKHLAIFTRRACPHCEKAMGLLDKIEAPYKEHEVSKFKQDEMNHLNEISGTQTVPKVFIGLKCIGGHEELQQSWKKKVLYDWLKKENISFKENLDAAAAGTGAGGKDAGKEEKKPADGAKKKKNKEDTTTTSSADDAGHKDTSKKKNDSQVDNKQQKDKEKKDKAPANKKTNASQLGNKGDNVGGIESDQKGASGTKDEGPLSHLGVKQFQSPDGGHKTTKEHTQSNAKLGASGKLDGRLGTRQTEQAKQGLGLDTGMDNLKAGSKAKHKEPLMSTQKGGSGTYNPAEKRDDSHVDHPLGLKQGVSPDDQSSVGDKHPNKVGTHRGDQKQPTNVTGKEGVNRRVVGNHGVDIGKGQSQDHRVNHDKAREREREQREAQ